MKSFRFAALCLALSLGLLAVACTQEVGLIDRTQANRLKKADLHGVWYTVAVVTDMPANAGFGFVGSANFAGADGGKVLFDIQEGFITVYPYTEMVVGSDAKWHKKAIRTYWRKGHEDGFIEVPVGNPVAVYPILSHFDVKRDYSPTTGAQSNVLVENTTDNPWWKREYMRVDWMGNKLPNAMFPQGSVKSSPVDYYVPDADKDNPSRFYMAPEGGYFHFTRRMFGQPMSTGACSTYSLEPGDCAGAAYEVRLSFRRADPKRVNDFEIRPYHMMDAQEKFGFFTSERYTYDEEYGLTYTGHDYKAARWNIWKKSKDFTPQKDAAGKVKACIVNADCDAPAVCDQPDWFAPGQCAVGARIEYRKRGLRPIVYHISADHPVDHLSAEYDTGDAWSDVMKDTVSWLYFWEDKWGQETAPQKGFTDGQSRFGQRFCQSHADCSGHALAQVAVDASNPKASRLVVAAGKAGGKSAEPIVVVDDLTTRPPLNNGSYVTFVNATAGSKATLQFASATIADVAYVAGDKAQDAKDHAAVLASADVGGKTGTSVDLSVQSGGKTTTLPNVHVKAGEAYFVVFFGGDAIAVLRSAATKTGLRLFNAIASQPAGGGAVSDGTPVEAGVNGTRTRDDIAYGEGSDFLFTSGDTVHAVFLKPGSRGDVSCMNVSGVGTCTGWHQPLTQADQASRLDIKNKLPPMFVMCANVYNGDQCKPEEKGNKAVLSDCRYWQKDDSGKDFNPCADVSEGGLVPHARELKIGGDLRYNYVYWVTEYNMTSPLGYGPAGEDPDTGEIIWATANLYGASLVTYAQYAKDLVDLLNGDLDASSLMSGKYIRDLLSAQSQSGKDKTLFDGAQALPSATPQQRFDAARKMATVRLADHAPPVGAVAMTAADRALVRDMENPAKLQAALDQMGPSFDIAQVQARMDQIKGTGVERAMINDEVALVLSEGAVQPGDAISPEMLGKISPTGWATPRAQMDQRKRDMLLGVNSIELAEFQDPSLIGLAQRMKCQPGQTPTDQWAGDNIGKAKCYKGDALRTALSVAILRGVVEHEVGHTVGLRHNFEASTDLLNYFDGYFDPNTGREKEAVLCGDVQTSAGTIPANKLCENETFGETCKLATCKVQADCPSGLACDGAQCIDQDGVQGGTCQSNSQVKTPCTVADQAAVCGGDGACVDGFCHSAIGCADNGGCPDGFTCQNKMCVSPRSGKPALELTTQQLTQEVRKYVPRAAPTDKEAANRRTEYQYASIMDYGGNFHSDLWGLGKYDYAAIKYGYGDMVEVYADPSYLIEQTKVYAKIAAHGSYEDASNGNLNTGNWKYGGTVTPSFGVLNDWMPEEYNRKRETVPAVMVETEGNNVTKYARYDADRTFFEVPYKYCSDEYNGNIGCYTWDTGVSIEEIVFHANVFAQQYYLFDAFKRERLWFGKGGSALGYLSRVQSRYFAPMADAGRFYALYNNIFRVYPWFAGFENQPFGMLQLKRASEAAFGHLAAIITSPAPGSYVYDKASNRYTNVSYDAKDTGEFNIPVGIGKMPWTTFATEQGYYYYDHPKFIGSYWDKVGAILTMTNSTANFLSEAVGEQLPLFRGTAIGFNTIYPKQLASLLGGLAAGDVDEIGGTVDQAHVFAARDPFRAPNKTDARVAPSIMNHGLRLFAAWQAIANLPAGFDPAFTDSMAIWLKGNGKQYDVGGGVIDGKPVVTKIVEYADPFGQKTYVAPRPNYDADRYSPTYRMLQKLNLMKTGCADGSTCSGSDGAAVCASGDKCGSVPSLANTTGAAQDAIAAEMKKETEIVDYFREMFKVYGSIGAGAP